MNVCTYIAGSAETLLGLMKRYGHYCNTVDWSLLGPMVHYWNTNGNTGTLLGCYWGITGIVLGHYWDTTRTIGTLFGNNVTMYVHHFVTIGTIVRLQRAFNKSISFVCKIPIIII